MAVAGVADHDEALPAPVLNLIVDTIALRRFSKATYFSWSIGLLSGLTGTAVGFSSVRCCSSALPNRDR